MAYFSIVTLQPDIQSTSLLRLCQRDDYGVHQMLWDLFPGCEKGAFLYRTVFSKQTGQYDKMSFFIVSHSKPVANGVFAVQTKPYSPQLRAGDQLQFQVRVNAVIVPYDEERHKAKKHGKRHDVVMHAQQALLHQLAQQHRLVIADKRRKREYKKAVIAADNSAIDDTLRQLIVDDGRYADALRQRTTDRQALVDLALKTVSHQAIVQWLRKQGERHGFSFDAADIQSGGYRHHLLQKGSGKAISFHSVECEGVVTVTDAIAFTDTLYTGIGKARGFGCGLLVVKRHHR